VELPPEVARAFDADMRAFFAENNGGGHKADEIAARQAWALLELGRDVDPHTLQLILI